MGKVKDLELKKKDAVERMLIDMWRNIGMDIPSNYEVIVQDCYEDVCETADPKSWHSGDVAIAFRRWIEAQTQRQVDAMYEAEQRTEVLNGIKERAISRAKLKQLQEEADELINGGNSKEKAEGHGMMTVINAIEGNEPKDQPYFEIVKQGWDEELQREEIQIHGGENANIFLIKTDDGFIVDVYGQNNSDPYTLAIWEENLMDEDEDDEDLVFEFGK